MAAKVVPYFILTADGVAMPPPSEEDSDIATSSIESCGIENPLKDSKRLPKTRQKVLSVSTRTEATKKRMEFIRQKLDESRERYVQKQILLSKAVPRLHDPKPLLNGIQDSSDNSSESSQRPVELVPLSHSKNKSTEDTLPYVYFVVSLDRTTTLKPSHFEFLSDLPPGSPFISKKKDRFLTSRSDIKKMRKEEKFRIQQEVKEGGLRTDPVRKLPQKEIVFPSSIRTPPLNPPTTPATTMTSAFYLDKPDDSMILPEEVDVSDFLDSRPSTKRCSTRFLELPHISADEQRKALGTAPASVDCKPLEIIRRTISQGSSNRRVHFSDGLPLITGSTITFSDVDVMRSSIGSRPSTIPALMCKEEQEVKSREKERPKFSRTKTSPIQSNKKHTESLNLPKIDIVSNVYNDLIIKAISAYIKQFPNGSQQVKLAKQLMQQLHEHALSTSDFSGEVIPGFNAGNIVNVGKRMVIKEIDPGLSDIIQGTGEANGKMTGNKVKTKTKRDREYNSLTPKSFKMAPPGLNKENTKLSVR